LDVTNPIIRHGEVVLLVGGNSGQEGKMILSLPLFYTSYPLVLYITTYYYTIAPTYITTMTKESLWGRIKKSRWYKRFRLALKLQRWPLLTLAQMKVELQRQHLNRIFNKKDGS
jgi:hypothetical protein